MKRIVFVIFLLFTAMTACKKDDNSEDEKETQKIVFIEDIVLDSSYGPKQAYSLKSAKVVGIEDEFDFAFLDYDTIGASTKVIDNTSINYFGYRPKYFLAGPTSKDLNTIAKPKNNCGRQTIFYDLNIPDDVQQMRFEDASDSYWFDVAFVAAEPISNEFDQSSDALFDNKAGCLNEGHLVGFKYADGKRGLIWIKTKSGVGFKFSLKYESYE